LVLVAVIMRPAPARAGIDCTVSMTNIAFGNIDVVPGTAIDTTGTITIHCNTDSNITVHTCISINAGSANDATSRQMVGPSSAKLRFELFSGAAATPAWGM